MKYRNKNRAQNHSKLGSRKHSSAPRVISMTRVSFDENGQFTGTEQVEAKLQFDPRNGCYHVMIDDDNAIGDTGNESEISDHELEQIMSVLEARNGGRA